MPWAIKAMKQFLLLIGALLMSSPVSAQSDKEVATQITPELRACESAPENGGTLQQALCYVDEDKRQDQLLNEVWRNLASPRREALRDSERQWIQQRSVNCTAEAAEYVNSTSKYMYNVCYADETIRRRLWLERHR